MTGTETLFSFFPRRGPVRIYRDLPGLQVFVGPWSCRVALDRSGYFANGSHYFSGWHRWREDADV